MKDLKEFLSKRLAHVTERADAIKEIHGKNPNNTHNYYGGQTLGYWQGQISAYENILDEIEDAQ